MMPIEGPEPPVEAEIGDTGASFKPVPDRDSDSEDETLIDRSHSGLDNGDYDESVLREAEEVEALLGRRGRFDGIKKVFNRSPGNVAIKLGDPEAKSHRRKKRRVSYSRMPNSDIDDEDGFEDYGSRSSSSDSAIRAALEQKKHITKVSSAAVIMGVTAAVALLCIFVLYLFYRSSSRRQPTVAFSNGTNLFQGTTVLVSLDGFRADFLNRGLTPALSSFITSGVSPLYMLPSFPSVTFPNHFSLVTGLYPESHGVVGNTFWDPDLEEEFYYTDPLRSMQAKWWDAEPLWVTAEKQGIRTAIHMWPGSEAHIPPLEPTYLDKFNGTEALTTKATRILELLDLPGDLDVPLESTSDLRPQLIAAYVPNVDADGHKYGPNSTEIRATIGEVDHMLEIIMEGLVERNLTEIVNLVVVSDHGMATTSTSRLIQLDDLIDMSLVDHIDGWPLRGLRLKSPSRDVPILYNQLLEEADKMQGFDVFTLDTMPERYHFTENRRIAPLWIIPKTGWAVVERTDFDVAKAKAAGTVYDPIGLHGYDHEHPLMRAIFVARGPAFPHAPNSRVPIFQNVEVYNIVCDSLGVKPHPSNGTLRLPLKIEGLHDDHGPVLETPSDPPQQDLPVSKVKPGPKPSANTGAADETRVKLGFEKDNGEHDQAHWLDAFHQKFEKFRDWVHDVVDKLKGKENDD